MRVSVLSVSQVNTYIKSVIDGDTALNNLFISGEISNFNHHYKSGHMYFSLKDDKSLISAVLFAQNAKKLKFNLQDGMKVIIRGRVSVYEASGKYQIYAQDVQPDGLGALNLAFEQLKEKLDKEGIFSELYKKPIPRFPKNIAVITSPTGAAVQDIFNILKRRWPVADVKLYPVSVQGELAVSELCEAVNTANEDKKADVIIIGRGGGSIEDLWSFNNETLARLIFSSRIPVISAVGHETDFTICDFVSDLRAPTPSAAAELATPDIEDIKRQIMSMYQKIFMSTQKIIENKSLRLDYISTAKAFKTIDNMFKQKEKSLLSLTNNLSRAMNDKIQHKTMTLMTASEKLDALSPLKVLSRGYAVILKDGKKISEDNEASVGDKLEINLKDQKLKVTVDEKEITYNASKL